MDEISPEYDVIVFGTGKKRSNYTIDVIVTCTKLLSSPSLRLQVSPNVYYPGKQSAEAPHHAPLEKD